MRRKLIIDTDMGVDDASALLVALQDPHAEVVAVTTVHGNVPASQATQNVREMLRMFPQKWKGTKEPLLFQGAVEPLVEHPLHKRPQCWAGHGKNGFGNAEFYDELKGTADVEVGKDHAVFALIRLVNQYPGEIDLICIGPLTNIALAISCEPHFLDRLKSMTSMGGSTAGRGNSSMIAEFNYHCDPEAANIVLNKFPRKALQDGSQEKLLQLIGWELTERMSFTWEKFLEIVAPTTLAARFLRKIHQWQLDHLRQPLGTIKGSLEPLAMDEFDRVYDLKIGKQWISPDVIAVTSILRPDLVTRTRPTLGLVETAGEHSPGGLFLDYYSHIQKPKNLNLVTSMDKKGLSDYLLTLTKGTQQQTKLKSAL